MRTINSATWVSSIALAMACLTSTAVHAQDDAGSGNQESAGIDEIIVSAQRREENLQDAALAISAVSGDDLVSRGVTTTDDLSKMFPSLVIQPGGGANVSPYLRGVGAFGAGPGNENAVAFSVDGIFSGRPSGTVGSFFDLARVEVLKGPQGTLYGRNSTGGAINLITRKPEIGDNSGYVTIEVGNYDLFKGVGAVNFSLGDNAAVRIAGQFVDRDGYLTMGYDDEVGQAVRAQLLWEPTDRLSVLLSGDYYHQTGDGVGSVIIPSASLPTAPAPALRISGADPASLALIQAAFPGQYAGVRLPNIDGYVSGEFYGVSATVNYDLDFATLTIIPAYRVSTPDYVSYRPGFEQSQNEKAEQFTGEIRLASPDTNRLSYVIGLYYYNMQQDSETRNIQARNNGNNILFDLSTESWAAFGEATFSLTDTFRVVGGVRYTEDQKSQAALFRSISNFVFPATFQPFSGQASWNKVTWKAGMEFDVAPDSLLYATVSTGYKSGGIGQYSNTMPEENIFNPERITAYTIGSKNRFFDNMFQLNLEGFYWTYRDQQLGVLLPRIEDPTSIGQKTLNVGAARFYGVDVDAIFAPTNNDTFNLNVQYLNTRYSTFVYRVAQPGPVGVPRINCPLTQTGFGNPRQFEVNCSGNPAVNAPKWSITAGYERTFRLDEDFDLEFGINTQFQSGRFLGVEYQAEQFQKSFMQTDASLTLRNVTHDWSVTAWINNIENTVVLNQAFQRTIQGSSSPTGPQAIYFGGLRPPRTFGLRATANF